MEYPPDPYLDPVAIVNWAIDTGIFDIAYSAWGWPIAEIIHFTGVCLLMGSVGIFDLRMMGRFKGLSLSGLHRLVPFGVLGFALCALSGTIFVASSPDQYLYNPAFQLKIVMIVVAGINMMVFYATTSASLKDIHPHQIIPAKARFMAITSFTCWMGVIAAGRVITAFRPPAWFWCGWCS